MACLKLGSREVCESGRPFVIAEAGVNHEGDLATAEEMVRQAAAAGADAIKFQTYTAERLAVAESPAYWDANATQQAIFRQYDRFGVQEYKHLAQVCEDNGIIFLSTPFDGDAVDYLAPIMPAFKIASADITNVPLLRKIAAYQKPVLLSTGASTLAEIALAVDLLERGGVRDICLMHCILHYPAEPHELNLQSIRYLKNVFPECVVGYSDHARPDPGMAILTSAALLGAQVLEKHFTLDKSLPGNDHYHAMDPDDLALAINNLRLVEQARGSYGREVLEAERPARLYARRSVVATRGIRAGERIQPDVLDTRRPGTGIPAADFDSVVGRVAKVDIPSDEVITWDMLV